MIGISTDVRKLNILQFYSFTVFKTLTSLFEAQNRIKSWVLPRKTPSNVVIHRLLGYKQKIMIKRQFTY